MSIDTKSAHITVAGGDVFADLGFGPAEAAALRVESQRIISEKLRPVAVFNDSKAAFNVLQPELVEVLMEARTDRELLAKIRTRLADQGNAVEVETDDLKTQAGPKKDGHAGARGPG